MGVNTKNRKPRCLLFFPLRLFSPLALALALFSTYTTPLDHLRARKHPRWVGGDARVIHSPFCHEPTSPNCRTHTDTRSRRVQRRLYDDDGTRRRFLPHFNFTLPLHAAEQASQSNPLSATSAVPGVSPRSEICADTPEAAQPRAGDAQPTAE